MMNFNHTGGQSMAQTTLYAYLQFRGNDDFPLEVVTERLGIEPTTTWKVGDRVRESMPLERFYTSWEYKVAKRETRYVEDVLQPIYDLFSTKATMICALKEELQMDVHIALVMEVEQGDMPGFEVTAAYSQFLSSIGASLDVDMYIYPFEEREMDA